MWNAYIDKQLYIMETTLEDLLKEITIEESKVPSVNYDDIMSMDSIDELEPNTYRVSFLFLRERKKSLWVRKKTSTIDVTLFVPKTAIASMQRYQDRVILELFEWYIDREMTWVKGVMNKGMY